MIVKNEARNIGKCLRSVVNHIDSFVICDTGSEDDTVGIINRFFSENKKDGVVLHHEWIDFGTNRTMALDACRSICDWALVIDADDWIEGDIDLKNLDNLVDAYRVKIENNGFINRRMQIFNMKNKHWVFREPIHEYPCCGEPIRVQTLEGNYTWRTGVNGSRLLQAGCQKKKYRADYEFIKAYLSTNPNNERMQFYLGQSAFDATDYSLAEEAYLKRAAMGGWIDEVFYSWYRVSICRELMGREKECIISSCLCAIDTDPDRAEPYVQASRVLRLSDMPRSAYMFAISGTAKKIDEEKLFVHKDCYLWRIYDEVGATAYYAGKMEEGRSACEKLLKDGHLPEVHRARVESNLRFYS
jgi:glycosyltransferase involved in cell wall biosynthesis